MIYALVAAERGTACVKIPYRGFEISLAFDNSCGASKNYSRSYLRVYKDDEEVTSKLYDRDEVYALTGEDVKDVFARIDTFLEAK